MILALRGHLKQEFNREEGDVASTRLRDAHIECRSAVLQKRRRMCHAGRDPSIKFARFWLQAWFLWWTRCTRHSGFVDLPPFDILDFKPWYYLEGDAPCCEDDDMEECDDIWGSSKMSASFGWPWGG